MKKAILLIMAIVSLSFCATAQSKKVAVWETESNSTGVSSLKRELVRSGLEEAVDNTPGYVKYDRAKFEDVLKEHKFQRSGAVKDEEVKRMGEYAGVQFVIVPQVELDGADFLIVARVIDVETGQSRTVKELCGSESREIDKGCSRVASRLLGNGNSSSPGTNWSGGGGASTLTIRVGNVSFDMVKVEAGTFTMGCTSEQGGDCFGDESPYHRVTISSDYYIGKYEVTQELWQEVMGNNPSDFKGFDRPVENVSWNDCVEFCNELSRMTGRRFRLPTEAEWEYAARGGKKSTGAKYSGSSSVANVAWYGGSSGGQTHPVGKLRPNELGIYDMSGNVWEWCSDWLGNYSSASQTDPYGPGSGQARVHRGGSWFNGAGICRVSYRSGGTPSSRDYYGGFRVVLVP